MKVISLVPSWTETLISAEVNVIGRTRFCIHPEKTVSSIPIIGGTKDLKIDKLNQLQPDIVIFDKEENTKEMYNRCNFNKLSTQVTSINSLSKEFLLLSKELKNKKLELWGNELDEILKAPPTIEKLENLPGIIEWVNKPPQKNDIKKIYYLIWKNPWMCVSSNTFIGSVFELFGFHGMIPRFPEKYPKLNWEDIYQKGNLILLSTEPYPFEKNLSEFKGIDLPIALIDGEKYSWYGIRTLNFLKSLMHQTNNRH